MCGWEDDHVQLANPLLRGGANGECLKEAQDKALSLYPVDVKSINGINRDPLWRPLKPADFTPIDLTLNNSTGYFHAALKDPPTYYWLPSA